MRVLALGIDVDQQPFNNEEACLLSIYLELRLNRTPLLHGHRSVLFYDHDHDHELSQSRYRDSRACKCKVYGGKRVLNLQVIFLVFQLYD